MSSEIERSSISESIYMGGEDPETLIDISTNPVTDILSFSQSLNRHKTIICTVNGFCIIHNLSKTIKRFEKNDSPFQR